MAKHEFGIVERFPIETEEFYECEPDKYNCIVINDNFIELIIEDLTRVDCYWYTRVNIGKGLTYSGITLIHLNQLIYL